MRNFKEVAFDSFDQAGLAYNEQVEVINNEPKEDSDLNNYINEQVKVINNEPKEDSDLNNYINDNSILQQLSRDTNKTPSEVGYWIGQLLPNLYDENLPVTENIHKSYRFLKAKKESGEPLTAAEDLLFNIVSKAKDGLDSARKTETKRAVMENLPLLIIGLVVIVLAFKFFSKSN